MTNCCIVSFHTFNTTSGNYTELECFIMNMLSLSTIKNPKSSANTLKVLKKQALTTFNCCNHPSKLSHSFGELYEHVKYVNGDNIRDAKEKWKAKNKVKKKK